MRKVPVIDIGNDEAVSSQALVRQLIYTVLLVATADRATEVRFEPSEPDSLAPEADCDTPARRRFRMPIWTCTERSLSKG